MNNIYCFCWTIFKLDEKKIVNMCRVKDNFFFIHKYLLWNFELFHTKWFRWKMSKSSDSKYTLNCKKISSLQIFTKIVHCRKISKDLIKFSITRSFWNFFEKTNIPLKYQNLAKGNWKTWFFFENHKLSIIFKTLWSSSDCRISLRKFTRKQETFQNS